MLIRFALLISALLIAALLAAFLFTRDARYFRLAIQVGRFILYVLLVFAALYLLERFGLVAWRVFV
ncbi:MAG: hypothetical protein PHQ60_08895 [Sideroxydans sp.]|nr:hypothetical protein [Sideroxydans sp.]